MEVGSNCMQCCRTADETEDSISWGCSHMVSMFGEAHSRAPKCLSRASRVSTLATLLKAKLLRAGNNLNAARCGEKGYQNLPSLLHGLPRGLLPVVR